uniref:Uncharacterized protein n=1 Tax=Anopheles atroparvus TaxID=41427 RepID=A0AAG5DHQ7_ANOAO
LLPLGYVYESRCVVLCDAYFKVDTYKQADLDERHHQQRWQIIFVEEQTENMTTCRTNQPSATQTQSRPVDRTADEDNIPQRSR